MTDGILGIHHVTAISGDPQRTLDFYSRILGLRLVKLTVNFDDPGTYHLYFGDELGHPGTILTFFPWPHQSRGQKGNGQLTETSFSISRESFEYWKERLSSNGVNPKEVGQRFGDRVLSFSDIDGQGLALVAGSRIDERAGWKNGPVPLGHAVKGFHSVTLAEESLERTESEFVDTLGFRLLGDEGNRYRYEVGGGKAGALVDIVSQPGVARGVVSVGTVHHVAFRARDDEQQKLLREEIIKSNPHVTPVIDRAYFHSIYFREPGGVLLEIATDPPGFAVDELPDRLGTRLMLPSWLEPSRAEIERKLPAISLPRTVTA